jgi:hypothetical protein
MQLLTTVVAPIVAQHVTEGRGFAVVRVPWNDDMPVDMLVTATTILATTVGRLVEQDQAGSKFVHVRDLGRRLEDGARYHETNASGSLHTDGPQLDNPPGLIFLACFRQAHEGGDSLLASAMTLHYLLHQARPDLLSVLHSDFYFARRGFDGGNERTFQRPIFRCASKGLSFRYLYDYILEGHASANAPLSRCQRDAIDSIQDLLLRDDIVIRLRLSPGEILIVDNRRVCHGRTSFRDRCAPGPARHLIRVWAGA